jgi:hypothetical protein
MPLSLYIDGQKWRTHLNAMVAAKSGLVPVIKGNGYGFGLEFLASESTRLGLKTVAVGLASEVEKVRSAFAGEIIVLSPDHGKELVTDSNVIQTISDIKLLETVDPSTQVIIEILTPLNRHGIEISELSRANSIVRDRSLKMRGFAVHLPIAKIDKSWIISVLSKLPQASTVWVSHLHDEKEIRDKFPELIFRERIGTSLWLGNESALEARATVLDNRVIHGAAGYRQRKTSGNVIVASGGTAHGIGLTAPQGVFSIIGRMKIIARALESLTGKMRSPFTWDGKVLNFLEPPHMQCSLIKSKNSDQPKVGDELKVRVRYTTTQFDQIIVR